MRIRPRMNISPLRSISLLVAFTLLLTLFPNHAYAADTGVTTSDVILRTKPSSSSVPLATIHANHEIYLLEAQGEWYKVKTGSLVGYIMTKYIKKTTSSAPPSSSGTGAASAPSSALKLGDNGSEVQALQKALKALGYFSDEATGTFGPITEAAVKAYQQARGLAADGIAGNTTLSRIAQENAPAAPAAGLLRKGDEGDAVKQMQQALKAAGYFSEEITGYFGAITEQALIAYQKAGGLTADGVAGSATLDRLLAAGSTSGSGGSTLIKLGDTGTSVSNLQALLKAAGFYSGSVDGTFGEGTQKALMQYQSASGLAADGVAGTQTLTLLSSAGTSTSPPLVTGSGSTDGSGLISGNSTGETSSGGTSTAGSLGGVGGAASVTPTLSNGSLKLADWWSGEINAVYPRKAIASVLDVRTGISFNIYRFGGTNHLDFEPATAADTELFMQICGGVGSWSARPCILTVNGIRYAAAMNTMAHGEYHLTDNNFDGQCCMHFVNSWTHGGKQSNADMQTQIMIAYNSGK